MTNNVNDTTVSLRNPLTPLMDNDPTISLPPPPPSTPYSGTGPRRTYVVAPEPDHHHHHHHHHHSARDEQEPANGSSISSRPERRYALGPAVSASSVPSAAAASLSSTKPQQQQQQRRPSSSADQQQENQAPTEELEASSAPRSPTKSFDGQHSSIADFAAELRTFFIHYQPSMSTQIVELVKAHSHQQPKLWRALFKKYGPFPSTEQTSSSSSSSLHSELTHFFRHWDPSLESKIDSILQAFCGFDDAMWQSLEAKFGPRASVPELANMMMMNSNMSSANFGEDQLQEASTGDFVKEASSGDLHLLQQPGKAMDLGSRLRRFFEAHDPTKMARVDEIAQAYRLKELELSESLRLLYDQELEAPIGGFKEAGEGHASSDARLTTMKQLRLTRGSLPAGELERWLTAFAIKFAPERLSEIEIMAARFKGKETQLREQLESVFGPVSMQHVPKGLDLAKERESQRRRREAEARAEPAEIRIKRVALQQRLQRFFEAYDKKMLKKTADMAVKFLNDEEKLFARLVKLHGPEPATGARLHNYRERLERFYAKYQPKLVAEVPQMLQRHAGHEDQLMSTVVRKYGPEPPESGASLERIRAYAFVKLECYLKFFDPVQNAQSIFKRYAATSKELELVAALEQLYGPLPPSADLTVTEPDRYGLPLELRPRGWNGEMSQASSSSSSSDDDDDGEKSKKKKDLSSKKPIVWTRNGVAPNDALSIKKFRADHERVEEGIFPVELDKIKPNDHDRRRLLSYFGYYLPERVNSVDKIYAVFGGNMDDLMTVLIKRYGPEPDMDNQYSKNALEESAKQLRQLFGKFLQHYDPSKLYEVDHLVSQYLGRIEDATIHLHTTYGPEPAYLPLAADLRRRLIFYFRWYDTAQLANVDVLADAYVGMEEQLFPMLEEQYGPEPKINFKADRNTFRQRLQRFMSQYPDSYDSIARRAAADCPDLDPAAISIEKIIARFEDFQDEFMLPLIVEYGAEPPDPEEEQRLRDEAAKREAAAASLRARLYDLFSAYDPEQLGENVEMLVESYWQDPETLMAQLYETYGVDHEEIEDGESGQQQQQQQQQRPAVSLFDGKHDDDDDNEVVVPPPPVPESFPDPSLWNRVSRMYIKYKIRDAALLPELAEKYKGRELELLDALVVKYGPEPGPDEDLTLERPPPLDISAISSPPAAAAEEQQQQQQSPKIVRPVVPIAQHKPPDHRTPAAVRAEKILRRYDPGRLPELPRLLKRYEGMVEDLVSLLEEQYELHPGTLIPVSQELRAEDLLDESGLEESKRRERERYEQATRKPVTFSMRERCLRMYQIYDVPAMVTLDLDLQRCGGDPQREEAYLKSLIDKYGEEPEGDVSYRHRAQRYYTYCVPKDQQKHSVADIMKRFHGRESAMMKMLLTKFNVPEPKDPEILLPLSDDVVAYRAAVRERVAAIYQQHNPGRLASLDTILAKYEGHEESLLDQLDVKFNLRPEDITIDREELVRVRALVSKVYELAAPQKLKDPAALSGLLKRYRLDLGNLEEQVAHKYPEAYRQAKRGDGAAGGGDKTTGAAALAAMLGEEDDEVAAPFSPGSPALGGASAFAGAAADGEAADG